MDIFRRTGVLRQYETLETRGLRQSSHNEAGLVSLSYSGARRDKDGSRWPAGPEGSATKESRS